MTRKWRIEVTQEDIDRGMPRSVCWCPVARAIKKVFYGKPGDTLIPEAPVKVANYRVEIDGGRAALPPEAVAFIKAFDEGATVQPFSFELS